MWIAIGGSLGSLARYWVGATIAGRMGTRFPYGTFAINITACVIIGFSLAFLGQRTGMNSAWRFLIPVGFVGAYSTFSTFEWGVFSNLQAGRLSVAGHVRCCESCCRSCSCLVRSSGRGSYAMKTNKIMSTHRFSTCWANPIVYFAVS